MLKLIGAVFVLTGTVGFALACKQELYDRLHHTRCLYRLLELLESEVRYSRASLPEACRIISNRIEEPYRTGLQSVWEEMQANRGLSFLQVWKIQMENCLQPVATAKKDKLLFLQLADSTGFADCRMQLRALEQCRELLGQSIKKQEESMENKTKVVMSMGLIGGLFLTIVLL